MSSSPSKKENETETETEDESESIDTQSDSDGEEEEASSEDEGDDVKIDLDENVVDEAAREAAMRTSRAEVNQTAGGHFVAKRNIGDITSLGTKYPWEIVNPSGVHPLDPEKSIFEFDINTELEDNEEARPWRAPGANPADWFNYGFNEQTWDQYRKRMLNVISNRHLKQKIQVLSKGTNY